MAKMAVRFTTICTMQRKYRKHMFYVDIVLDHKEQTYNAWITSDGYGVKNYMFGGYVHTQCFGEPFTETAHSFTKRAMDDYNFKNGADLFIEQYMDGEEN